MSENKIIESVKNILKEWSGQRPGDITKECYEEFHENNPKIPLIERFYINKGGRYNPVEIRDRLKRDRTIVEIDTGDYSRDQGIANLILSLILEDDDKCCHEKTELKRAINDIETICRKYNIKLEDVAETLEEYICLDNGEEL